MTSQAVIVSITLSGLLVSIMLIVIIVLYRKWMVKSVILDEEKLGLINGKSGLTINQLNSKLDQEKTILPAKATIHNTFNETDGDEETADNTNDYRQVGYECVNIIESGKLSHFGVILRLEKSNTGHKVHIKKVLYNAPRHSANDNNQMKHIVVILGLVFRDGSIRRFKTEMAPVPLLNRSANQVQIIELNQQFELVNSSSRHNQFSLDNLSDQLELQIILLDKYARRRLKVDCLVCWEKNETDETIIPDINDRQMLVIVPEIMVDEDEDNLMEDFNFDDNGNQLDYCSSDNKKCNRIQGYVTSTTCFQKPHSQNHAKEVLASTKINKIEPRQSSSHYHRRWENIGNEISLWLEEDQVKKLENADLCWLVQHETLNRYKLRHRFHCKGGLDRYQCDSEISLIPRLFESWNILCGLVSEPDYLLIIHTIYRVPFKGVDIK